jgi:23S rRNA (guanosine2251-2'-O)-methyltransferase
MVTEKLYGRRPVLEVLRANRRQISRLVVAEGVDKSKRIADSIAWARSDGIAVQLKPRSTLDSMVRGANHQGIVAEVSPYPFVDLHEVLDRARQQNEAPLFLLLDLIQDVQNVGTLPRSGGRRGSPRRWSTPRLARWNISTWCR